MDEESFLVNVHNVKCLNTTNVTRRKMVNLNPHEEDSIDNSHDKSFTEISHFIRL